MTERQIPKHVVSFELTKVSTSATTYHLRLAKTKVQIQPMALHGEVPS